MLTRFFFRFLVSNFVMYSFVHFTNMEQSVRNDFVLPVNRERREMVGNIILYFSVLSGAFKLKTPLPPYLPPAERARQSLVMISFDSKSLVF